MRNLSALCVLSGCALGFATSVSSAASLPNGTYFLLNHPDGNQAEPFYGLRLDELFDATGSHDVFTFDFNAPGSDMRMTVDDDSIRIFGVSVGGRDVGGSYALDQYLGIYAVDFTYDTGVGFVPGDDDRWVDGPNNINTGTITAPNALGTVALEDERGSHPFSFRLGDGTNDNGHRGFAGFSGWGWLNHSDKPHVYSSDWLFAVGQEVPGPGPAALALTSVGLFMKKRRRTSA